ncbi:MAG: hypothetical protein RIT43_2044, partial [Bacteroidota bacterium]
MLINKIKHALLPLVAILVCSYTLLSQSPCNLVERKIDQLTDSDSENYKLLIQELVKCEKINGIDVVHSRSNYHKARLYLKNGEFEKADKLISTSLAIQENQETRIDFKLLQAASFMFKGQPDSSLKISNEVIHSQISSTTQLAKAYQYAASC